MNKDGQFVGYSTATQRKTKRYIPPSDVAIFFYLVNRKGDFWSSINRAEMPREDDKGEILKAIQNMKPSNQKKNSTDSAK